MSVEESKEWYSTLPEHLTVAGILFVWKLNGWNTIPAHRFLLVILFCWERF